MPRNKIVITDDEIKDLHNKYCAGASLSQLSRLSDGRFSRTLIWRNLQPLLTQKDQWSHDYVQIKLQQHKHVVRRFGYGRPMTEFQMADELVAGRMTYHDIAKIQHCSPDAVGAWFRNNFDCYLKEARNGGVAYA